MNLEQRVKILEKKLQRSSLYLGEGVIQNNEEWISIRKRYLNSVVSDYRELNDEISGLLRIKFQTTINQVPKGFTEGNAKELSEKIKSLNKNLINLRDFILKIS